MFIVFQSSAQMFDWKTNDSINEIDSLGGAYLSLYMVNNTSDSLRLDWHFVENSFPPEWDWTLCDYTTCYLILPDTGSMTTLQDKEEGFIGISINTNKHPAYGILRFYVYNDLNPADGDTATFILNSTYTGITENSSIRQNIILFPNPVSHSFSLKNLSGYSGEWWLVDLRGKVLCHETIKDKNARYDISNVMAGAYYIRLKEANGAVTTISFIKY